MTTHHNLKQEVLSKIKAGAVVQKPKWRFVMRVLFLVLSVITLALASLYLISYVALVTGELYIFELFGLGSRGVQEFFVELPWLLLLLIATLIGLVMVLVRHFEFAYKRPAIVSISGIILVITLVSVGVHTFDSEHRIPRFGEDMNNPVFHMLHSEYREGRRGDVTVGKILSVSPDGFVVEVKRSSTTVRVIVNNETKGDVQNIFENQMILVIGEEVDGVITAEGVKPAGDRGRRPVPPPIMDNGIPVTDPRQV